MAGDLPHRSKHVHFAQRQLRSGGAGMCAAWLCHSWFYSLGIELLILSLLAGMGAVLHVLMCRIWGEAGEEAGTADRSMTAQEATHRRAV